MLCCLTHRNCNGFDCDSERHSYELKIASTIFLLLFLWIIVAYIYICFTFFFNSLLVLYTTKSTHFTRNQNYLCHKLRPLKFDHCAYICIAYVFVAITIFACYKYNMDWDWGMDWILILNNKAHHSEWFNRFGCCRQTSMCTSSAHKGNSTSTILIVQHSYRNIFVEQ